MATNAQASMITSSTAVIETTVQQNGAVDNRTRVLLLAVRQGLIIILGALEDFLDLERSITPKRKR